MAARPDPRPARLVVAMSGLVAATAIATGLIQPAPPPPDGPDPAGAGPGPDPSSTTSAAVQVRRVTRYVQLRPGETAPPGARVVRRPDPSPRVVVVTIPAPGAGADAPAPAPARRTARTRQSGG